MSHGVSVEGLLAQANFGRKSRKFEEIKETPENGESVTEIKEKLR
jgi:hypothetical protein